MVRYVGSLHRAIVLVKAPQEAQEQGGRTADHQRKGGWSWLVGHVAILPKKVNHDVLKI